MFRYQVLSSFVTIKSFTHRLPVTLENLSINHDWSCLWFGVRNVLKKPALMVHRSVCSMADDVLECGSSQGFDF